MIVFLRPLWPTAKVVIDRVLGKNAVMFSKHIIHPDKVEQLLAEAKAAPDFETYKTSILALQKATIDENAMFFPMLSPRSAVFMKPEVQNLGMFITNGFDWDPENVWIKK
jgi:hypothetical protein